MKNRVVNAKCPYCKTEFVTSAIGSGSWAQSLWGQYAPDTINHTCPGCGEISEVTVIQISKYSARKLRSK